MPTEKVTFETLPTAIENLAYEVSEIKRLLLESSSKPPTESEQPLTIKEAAEFLNLSVTTIYGKVHETEIPFYKKGKRLYFSKKELSEWIKTGRKKTNSELDAEADAYLNNLSERK